uniref:Sister chromatid cohesion 1 protein 2 n=1 Tax=Cucumis melo TaxID=3656 RepID=A0A9I9CTP9_CUCME
MAYLLLGIARIYSKKVEYLYTDCNKVLTEINEFVVRTKNSTRKGTKLTPYYAITLPERFELDEFDLGIIEDLTGSHTVSHEEITLKDNIWNNDIVLSLDQNHDQEITALHSVCCSDVTIFEDVFSPHLKEIEMQASTLHHHIMPEKCQMSTLSDERYEVEVSTAIESADVKAIEQFDEDHRSDEEETWKEKMLQHENVVPEASTEMVLTNSFSYEETVTVKTVSITERESSENVKFSREDCHSEGMDRERIQSDNETEFVNGGNSINTSERSIEKLRDNTITLLDSMDIDMSLGAQIEPMKLIGTGSREGDNLKFPEMQSPEMKDCDGSRNDQLSISLDGVLDSRFPDFTGGELKRSIYDARDLVSKRRKCPCSALTAWKASQISRLSFGFSMPLMSCVSPELRSLFETIVNISKSTELVKSPENLDVPSSPAFHTLVKMDSPVTIFKTGEHSNEPEISGSIATYRSEQITTCVDRVAVSEASVLELSTSEPQISDGLEQIAIAPGTPVRCSTSARLFRSPDSPKVSNSNAQIKFCEVDELETDGWSGRTRMVAEYLLQNFTNQRIQSAEEAVNLSHLLSNKTRKESAGLFYEILVLKTKDCVDVKQDCAYGDILVWKLSNWSTAFGSGLSIMCED